MLCPLYIVGGGCPVRERCTAAAGTDSPLDVLIHFTPKRFILALLGEELNVHTPAS